jgi:hypothetical protein
MYDERLLTGLSHQLSRVKIFNSKVRRRRNERRSASVIETTVVRFLFLVG